MAQPLRKTESDGTPYRRPATVESQVDNAVRLTLPEIRRCVLITDRDDPEYLCSECLVHLVRKGRRTGDQPLMSVVLPVLLGRCEANLFVTVPDGRIPVRCHVAVPFGDADTELVVKAEGGVAEAAPARPDEVRRSFNTPFWPHVLATTSVGQEGLDFHPWCSHVVHWDLSSNPLDLEQREGRIQRYAGLSVRRRLCAELREEVLGDPELVNDSPWRCVQRHAERFVDASGLRPWWVLDGAEIRRHVFERPFGRDSVRFAQLREQRMIYRLALGQPNQEDFIDVLSRGGEVARGLLRPLVLDLSAMGLRQMTTETKDASLSSDAPRLRRNGAAVVEGEGVRTSPVPKAAAVADVVVSERVDLASASE